MTQILCTKQPLKTIERPFIFCIFGLHASKLPDIFCSNSNPPPSPVKYKKHRAQVWICNEIIQAQDKHCSKRVSESKKNDAKFKLNTINYTQLTVIYIKYAGTLQEYRIRYHINRSTRYKVIHVNPFLAALVCVCFGFFGHCS